ncbi:MAG: dephospho-CoA kinase [Legionellaceae bacterium]|nr:dephospho-CoA kinase [Legionellaceae bacterium]
MHAVNFVVGVVGTLASGKSTACKILQAEGVTYFNADQLARTLLEPPSTLLDTLIQHFGPQYLLPNGQLDRLALRQRLCVDLDSKKFLEETLHPPIRAQLKKYIEEKYYHPYVIIEISVFYDRSQYSYIDRILCITSPLEQQIQRASQRDQRPEFEIQQLLSRQASTEQLQSYADDIVQNDSTLSIFTKKIRNIHQRYLQLAQLKSS